MQPYDFICPAVGPVRLERKEKMNIRIKLSTTEVKEIVKAHVLKEVPVHTAGKNVYVSGGHYSNWEVEINDEINDEIVDDATL